MDVLHIYGTRPQFIKVAMLTNALNEHTSQFLLNTGQHYDARLAGDIILDLGLQKADLNLGIGSSSQSDQTARMMIEIEKVLETLKPRCICVYGDTNSTLAGALVAAKMRITLLHIEAGLRSFNKSMPEEVNRIICDHLSDHLFCPTKNAVENLANESILENVYLVGDVMADAIEVFRKDLPDTSSLLHGLKLTRGNFCLLTLHRPRNVDIKENFQSILQAISMIDKKVIFPIHPRTRKMQEHFNLQIPSNIILINPITYKEMLALEENCDCILTDSGGIQKEAYLLKKRCITLREETEWIETVESKWNILAGSDPVRIIDAYQHFHPSTKHEDLFGDSHAAEKISHLIREGVINHAS